MQYIEKKYNMIIFLLSKFISGGAIGGVGSKGCGCVGLVSLMVLRGIKYKQFYAGLEGSKGF